MFQKILSVALVVVMQQLLTGVAFAQPEGGQIIQVTESGVVPTELRLKGDDLSVFILNSSKSSLITFEIEYTGHEVHCTNDSLKSLPNGAVITARPLSPRDFAPTCFHEAGTYPIKIFGVPGHKEPVIAKVILEK